MFKGGCIVRSSKERRNAKMFENSFNELYASYDSYVREANANDVEPVSFFKYAFGFEK